MFKSLLESLLQQIQENGQSIQLIKQWKHDKKIIYDKQISIEVCQLYYLQIQFKNLFYECHFKHPDNRDREQLASLFRKLALLLAGEELIYQPKILLDLILCPYSYLFLNLYDLFNKNGLFENFDSKQAEQYFESLFSERLTQDNFTRLAKKTEREGAETLVEIRAKIKRIIVAFRKEKIFSEQSLDEYFVQQPEIINVAQVEQFLEQKFQDCRLSERNQQQIEGVVSQFVSLLQRIDFNKMGLGGMEYQYFGSQLNGFGMENSDVDFTLLTNSFVEERILLKFIHQELLHQICATSFQYTNIYEKNVRIPLLGIKHKTSHSEIDLCVNNILGAVNTKILLAYSQLHPKIQKVGVLLKKWGKKCHVITKQRLSSYALILMFICFLQRSYSLPFLSDQDPAKKQMLQIRRIKQDNIEEFKTNCYFIQDASIIQEMMQQAKKKLDATDLQQIIVDFWDYYIRYFEELLFVPQLYCSRGKKQVSIIYPENQCSPNGLFSIEDPIDQKHDPGEKMINQDPQTKQLQFISMKKIFREAPQLMEERKFDVLFG